MRSFLVWFQAEQTIPNPLVVDNNQLPIDGAIRVRLAHEAGWPSDMLTWARVIRLAHCTSSTVCRSSFCPSFLRCSRSGRTNLPLREIRSRKQC